ncbi:MAG: DegV family protein [Kineosporiaceae bacterium]
MAVVTDSTAYLPPDVVRRAGVTVVPLQVILDGRSLPEGEGTSAAAVAGALRAGQTVTTSRPAPALFAATYRQLAEAGFDAVVSVHLSSDVSGTVDAARVASREVAPQIPVRVVDARSVGMGLGFAVLAAVRAAGSPEVVGGVASPGDAAEGVAEVTTRAALATRVWFYVDTLEYLRRGGRLTAARAWLGTALAVKPLLHLVDGRIELLERVRTASRALGRLQEIVVGEVGESRVDVVVHHLDAAERAQALAAALGEALPGCREVTVSEIGAVVGAHVGPGLLAVVTSPVAGGAGPDGLLGPSA